MPVPAIKATFDPTELGAELKGQAQGRESVQLSSTQISSRQTGKSSGKRAIVYRTAVRPTLRRATPRPSCALLVRRACFFNFKSAGRAGPRCGLVVPMLSFCCRSRDERVLAKRGFRKSDCARNSIWRFCWWGKWNGWLVLVLVSYTGASKKYMVLGFLLEEEKSSSNHYEQC
jgi:hypothetical protein